MFLLMVHLEFWQASAKGNKTNKPYRGSSKKKNSSRGRGSSKHSSNNNMHNSNTHNNNNMQAQQQLHALLRLRSSFAFCF